MSFSQAMTPKFCGIRYTQSPSPCVAFHVFFPVIRGSPARLPPPSLPCHLSPPSSFALTPRPPTAVCSSRFHNRFSS